MIRQLRPVGTNKNVAVNGDQERPSILSYSMSRSSRFTPGTGVPCLIRSRMRNGRSRADGPIKCSRTARSIGVASVSPCRAACILAARISRSSKFSVVLIHISASLHADSFEHTFRRQAYDDLKTAHCVEENRREQSRLVCLPQSSARFTGWCKSGHLVRSSIGTVTCRNSFSTGLGRLLKMVEAIIRNRHLHTRTYMDGVKDGNA